MTAGIKANVDGSAAIQVGGTDVITFTSGGAASFTQGAASFAQPANLPNTFGFKNRIINGAMSFWQRGTSFTNPSVSGSFYTADRWGVNRAGDVTGATVSRSTDVPAGFQYSLRLQRTAGNTSTAGLFLFNSNETVNTLDLAGHPVTFSFWAKAGANYSGGLLQVIANSGTGTDQRVYAYTGSVSFISANQAITSTWTRYSFTGTVAANATEVGSYIAFFPNGTAGADDSIYVTGLQIEKGSTATSFDYRPYGTEEALCQRYYYRITAQIAGDYFVPNAYAIGTTLAFGFNQFPVPMRTSPTALEQSGVAANYIVVRCGAGTTATCSAVPSFSQANLNAALTLFTVASGLVNSGAGSVYGNTTSTYLGWSAEL
jgi:hypothetical protein